MDSNTLLMHVQIGRDAVEDPTIEKFAARYVFNGGKPIPTANGPIYNFNKDGMGSLSIAEIQQLLAMQDAGIAKIYGEKPGKEVRYTGSRYIVLTAAQLDEEVDASLSGAYHKDEEGKDTTLKTWGEYGRTIELADGTFAACICPGSKEGRGRSLTLAELINAIAVCPAPIIRQSDFMALEKPAPAEV